MRFRRALDCGSVTEALSAASELQFVALAEALELTLLLADKEPEKYDRAAARWHSRFLQETKNVDLRESLAVLTSSRRSRPTASPLPPSQSFSAADAPANGSPRPLSSGAAPEDQSIS